MSHAQHVRSDVCAVALRHAQDTSMMPSRDRTFRVPAINGNRFDAAFLGNFDAVTRSIYDFRNRFHATHND